VSELSIIADYEARVWGALGARWDGSVGMSPYYIVLLLPLVISVCVLVCACVYVRVQRSI
jgi:hypothetical protein